MHRIRPTQQQPPKEGWHPAVPLADEGERQDGILLWMIRRRCCPIEHWPLANFPRKTGVTPS